MKKLFARFLINYKTQNQKDESFHKLKKNFEIEKIFNAFSNFNQNSEIRYVGGCVRKILNKEVVDDIDFAVNINPTDVKQCLKNNNIEFFETGIKHGTITARVNEKNFEITSLRKDLNTDGRHASVSFTDNWKEDSLRRDLSINSIYADINGNIFDPHEGVNDLKLGIVKFIGNPDERIKEDYLRILRYVRFFLLYSKSNHSDNIKRAIKQNLDGILNLSKERLLDEFKKIVLSKAIFKVKNDNFCLEIILLVFPQLVNLDKLNKLTQNQENIIWNKNFIFILSFLIIDKSDNSDYFIYKFNLSNNAKKKINYLKNIFGKNLEKNFFDKKNLEKIFYFDGKEVLLDIIDFHLLQLKKINKKIIELKKYFQQKEVPKFPIKAEQIMEQFKIKEGKELGEKLRFLESLWVSNGFSISEKDIKKTFSN